MPALTNARFKALRAAFDAFSNIQKLLLPPAFPDEGLVETIHQLVQQTNRRAPGVLLPFSRLEYIRIDTLALQPVKTEGVRAYVASAIALLDAAIQDEGSISVDSLLDFAYVRDKGLRAILQRDYRELLRAISAKCWKAAVVLSGALIEAVLADRLLHDAGRAASAVSAPKKSAAISTWRFADLIDVAVEVGAVSKGAAKLSHSVRDFRNLVHLQKELTEKLSADEQEARIAFNILGLIDRDLRT